jgi:hypothetical protein
MTIPKISLHKSNIEQQHRPILDQPPADWIYDRDSGFSLRAAQGYRRAWLKIPQNLIAPF